MAKRVIVLATIRAAKEDSRRQATLPARVCTVFLILATALLAATSPPAGLHIDHVPIAVRDLASAVVQFRAMGFTIKPGRPHQNGIENASIKFADGSMHGVWIGFVERGTRTH